MKIREDEVELDDITLTLELDDGRTVECDILTCYPLNGKQYIAVAPKDQEEIEEIYLYRFHEDENGDPVLDMIEDDDEYEAAADRFDEILDEQEYDEWVPEEES